MSPLVKPFLPILLVILSVISYAQTGPAGVGSSSDNVMWLRADDLSASLVSTWSDQSGNANDVSQATSGEQPTWVDATINGLPVVRFDGSNDVLDGPASNALIGDNQEDLTVMVVYKTTSTTREYIASIKRATNSTLLSLETNYDGSATNAGYTGYLTRNEANSAHSRIVDAGPWNDDTPVLMTAWIDDSNRELFINGTSESNDTNGMQDVSGNTAVFTLGAFYDGAEHFEGDIAEFIIFTSALNSAQRRIVENYLAAKYNLTIANDLFTYESAHGNELAGIGRVDVSNEHTSAQSAGIFNISGASSLGDGDYMLFGHEGGSVASWTTTEIPSSLSNIQRIGREWRLDETGDVGTVTVTVDNTLLPSLPSEYTEYYLLIDSDGDFTSGATTHLLSSIGGSEYQATTIDFSDGDHVTIAAVRPVIEFTATSTNAFEDVGTVNLEVNLNYAISSAAQVVFSVNGGSSATEGGGNDYTITASPLTITAGSTTNDVVITVNDESDMETDETVIVDLSSPTNAVLGSNTSHTLTIHDNDEARTIQFQSTSSNGSEATSPASITIESSSSDVSDITVDYTVTGGTASGSGIDYTLAAGTATITGDGSSTTTTLDISINEDILDEVNETIIITLSNPSANTNLGANTIHTYTINDNDSEPTVEFTSTTGSASEASSPTIEVSLSGISGQDITVDYTVADVSATGNGTDYSLSSGTLTIDAGNSLGFLSPSITDDSSIEGGETFTVTLSSPSGASLGSNTVHTFTISDNDSEGFTGPGGVGDSNSNVMWLRADDLSSSPVSTWSDQSGNGNDVTQGTGAAQPAWVDAQLNGLPVLRFDGTDDYLDGPASNALIGDGQEDLTTIVVYNTMSTSRQYISSLKRTTGSNSLYSLEINYDGTGDNSGYAGFLTQDEANSGFSRLVDAGPWNDDSPVLMISMVDDSNRELFINGTSRGTDTDGMFDASGNTGAFTIGGFDGTQLDFDGDIAEYMIFTRALNSAERIVIENYLAAKYDLTITNDNYFYQVAHGNEVTGIGRVDASNTHQTAQSAGIFKVGSPDGLGNGEYLFFGHDGGSIASWTTTEAPNSGSNIQRIAREWRLDETGDVGSVSIGLDVTSLPSLPSEYTSLVVMLDSDGDFSSGATTYPMTSLGGNEYEASAIDITDGQYLAFAVVRPVVEFNTTASQDFEPNGPVSIAVDLNFSLNADVTVDYAVNGSSTATGSGTDYTLADGTLTITAGNTSANINIPLNNDIELETDETIILDLSSPSGAILGTNAQHTFSINDDDNSRKINFTASSASGDEGTTPAQLTVQINSVDNTNPTTVEYTVTGGTATGSGIDYTLASGTATIIATETTTTIDISINEDVIDEDNETIEVTLSSPTNSNLESSNTVFTYTINDNDAAPTVEFTSPTGSASESSSPSIEISLSGISGQDITVDYTVADGTATGGTIDYELASGTANITAGNSITFLNPSIIDDSDIESGETFTVTLSSPSGATLGTNTVHTFTISDNDSEGFTGPGGVGGSSNNVMWLKADDLSASPVSTWSDQSGNGNDVTQGTGSAQPAWVDGEINGLPVVRFDGTDDFLDGPASNALIGNGQEDLTTFVVYNTSGTSQQYISSIKRSTGSNSLLSLEVNYDGSGTNSGYAGFLTQNEANSAFSRINDAGPWNDDNPLLMTAWVDELNRELFINGTSEASDTDGMFDASGNTGVFTIGSFDGTTLDFEGDIAEYVIYTAALNSAQRIIVENYLAAKYGLTIANDNYLFEISHGNEVAGIGRVDASNTHQTAQSSGIFKVGSPEGLGDNEYLLFGHDAGDISAWTTTEAPSSGSNIQRIAREWRLDETGDVGNVSLGLDISSLPALPSEYTSLVVMLDSDGDFSSGATLYPMTSLGGNEYEASSIDIADGNYLAFAVVRPVIEFNTTTSQDFEPNGPVSIAVDLNFSLNSDVTVDYAVNGSSTATGSGTDYTLADGTLTITAGNTSANINIPLTNDTELESDETIILDLSSPSGATLGSNTQHTFQINDDDNSRKINFTASSSAGDEGTTPVSLTIQINSVDAVNPTTVDYAVTGGTATGGGPDFTLADGTATITATNTTTTIDIIVNEDVLDEDDETIEITLSSPTNCNLESTNTVYTYTINDNDAAPTIQFTSATGSGSESSSPSIEVSLSGLSGQDITVDYTVADGTATGGTIDYELANGTATITAGNTVTNINPAITDDAIVESGETFTVTLSSPSGATLGSNTVHTFTIGDNDSEGFEGPGGVGDNTTNVLWVKADDLSASPVSTWADQSGNGNDLTQGTGAAQPAWVDAQVNGLPIVRFDGTDDLLNGPATNALIGNAQEDVTTIVVYNTTSTARQYISSMKRTTGNASLLSLELNYDGTGDNAGYAGYLTQDEANTGFSRAVDAGPWNDDSPIIMTAWIDELNRELFMNGTSEYTDTDGMFDATGNTGVFTLGGFDGTQLDFDGDIAEYIIYTSAINSAQRTIIENYLAAKYGITISNDQYAYQANNSYEVAGIGQVDASNAHSIAESGNLLKIGSPSGMGDNEFLLFGHDNGDISAWSASEVPGSSADIQRITREWRLDETGDVGTISIGLDITDLPSLPTGYNQLVVLLDADGDFTSGSTTHELVSLGGNEYEVSGVDITDGDYLAFAVQRSIIQFNTTTSSEFEPNGPALVAVDLNLALSSDVTVDYTITGGTATGSGTDYVLADGTITITSGNTSSNISITLVDDTEIESNETIELVISNPSSGVTLGTNTSHTFSINDDDSNRKINFTASSSSGGEATTPVTLTIESTLASTSATTVDYTVTGGTATGGGEDYTLADGTATIPGDNVTTTTTIDIVIVDDLVDEDDEDIVITLSNPTNGNLEVTDTEYTYTITDNDAAPTVQFTSTTSNEVESVGTANVQVELSAASGNIVSVVYTVADVSATGSGTDYTLASGTLNIPAGFTTGTIDPVIVDDSDLESSETFTITLSAPTNATLGTNTVNTFTISDNDDDGFDGPGGVGSSTSNVLWLRGDDLSATPVSTWSDQSGNGNDVTQGTAGNQPAYVASGLNSLPVVRFDGSNDLLTGPATNAVIGENVDNITVITVFQTSSTQRGYLSSLKRETGNGTLLSIDINSNGGSATSGYAAYLSQNDANTTLLWLSDNTNTWNDGNGHILTAHIEGANRELLIDGTSYGTDANGLASVSGNTGAFTLGAQNSGANHYNGDVAEYIIYTIALNSAERIVVENYLAAKYALTIANDRYVEGSYPHDVAGIGSEGASDEKQTAQSAGLLGVRNASSLDANDYLLFGHDDGSIASWAATEIPNSAYQRIAREWLIEETNDVGTVTVTLDITSLPALPAGFGNYAVLIDSDGDADFTTGSPTAYCFMLESGSSYFATLVDVADNNHMTIAAVQNVSAQTGSFNDPATWLSGMVPGSGDAVTIANGDNVSVTANQSVGSITIENGGILTLSSSSILTVDNGDFTVDAGGTFTVGTGTVDFAADGAQCISGTTYYNLTLSGTGTKTLCGNIDVDNDLFVSNAGAILDVDGTNDYSINLAGDWNNDGSFTGQNGTIIFDGTGAQEIATGGSQTFNNLTVNKTLGTTLSINTGTTINGTLTMTQGNIDIGSNDLTLSATTTISGGSANSYIQADGVGSIVKSYTAVPAAAITFPIGDSDEYAPFTLTLQDGTLSSASISLNLRDSKNGNLPFGIDDFISRYYNVIPSGITGSIDYDISFIYTDADVNGVESRMFGAKYSSSTWESGGSVNTGTNTVTWNGLTSFSEVTASEDPNIPLPVELLFIKAEVIEEEVKVEWATASELNNDYFEIEKTQDLKDFEVVGRVEGSGTTSETIHYELTDTNPYPGISYYRMKQVDYDGTTSYSEFVRVEMEHELNESRSEISVYPIPSKLEDGVDIEMMDIVPGTMVRIDFITLDGRVGYSLTEFANASGQISKKVFLPSHAVRGEYVIYFRYEGEVKVVRTSIR